MVPLQLKENSHTLSYKTLSLSIAHNNLAGVTLKGALYNHQQWNNGEAGNSWEQVLEQDNAAPHASADIALVYTPDSLKEWSLAVNTKVGKWPEDAHILTTTKGSEGNLLTYYQQQKKPETSICSLI